MKKQFQSKAVPRGTRTIWRYLSALIILFTFAIGNVWADSVTFSAADMSEQTSGAKKGKITVYCPTKAGDQQAYKSGGSAVKHKAISLGSSADTAVIVPQSGKSVQFRADANYKITGISIFAAANKDSICGEPIVIWAGAVNNTPAYVGTIEAPSRAGTSDPDPIVVTGIPNNATAFALYRRIKYNSSTGVIGSGSNFGRSQQTWNIFSVTVTYESTTPATTYTVTYSAGDGSVKEGKSLPTQAAVAEGTEITLASAADLEKEGKEFDGWLCNINSTKYAAGAKYTMTAAATTFTAQWRDPAPKYTVTLMPAGGSAASYEGWTYDNVNNKYTKEVSDGTELALPTFTKENRTFKTWRKAGPTDVTSPITVTADVTLTAVWNATVENVIYSWEGAEGGATEVGGTAQSSTDGGSSFDNAQINVAQAGYYCIQLNGKNDYSTNIVEITLSGSEKVKAGDKIRYTGFYNHTDTKNAAPKMRASDGTAIFTGSNLPNINSASPRTDTHTVPEGINTATVQLTRAQTQSSSFLTKLQIIREVLVEETNLRTVTFDYNDGGATASTSVEVAPGSKVSAPADPTRAHYRFHEWQLGGVAYDFATAVTSNITLVADWIQLYTISFAAGDGSGDAPAAIEEKAATETFTVPENTYDAPTNKVFAGWNDGTNDYAPGDTYTVGTANVLLTAQWVDDNYEAKIGTTMYPTFAEALTHAADGEIILLQDIELDAMLTFDYDVTIDLNGYKWSKNDGNSLVQVTNNKTLTINGTTANSEFYGRINVGKATNDNGHVVLNGGYYHCTNAQTVLHVNGTCLASNVSIVGATVLSPTDNGIQLCGQGNYLIKNSTITGYTAVYHKSGVLTIENSHLVGTGAHADFVHSNNGANATGDALVVEACDYPGGAPTIVIPAMVDDAANTTMIESNEENTVALNYIVYNNATPVVGQVAGGTFDSEVPAAVCAENYAPKDNGDGTYGVKPLAISVDFTDAAVRELGVATALSNYHYTLGSTTGVSFDNSNAFDTGLKMKTTSGNTLTFDVAAGKLITLTVGMINGMTISVNGASATALTSGTDAEHLGVSYYYSAEAQHIVLTETSTAYNIIREVKITDPYVVTFNANGGEDVAAATFYGTAITLPSATKGTDSFLGWFDAAEGGNKIGEAGESYTPSASIELFAHWESVSTDTRIKALTYAIGAGAPVDIYEADKNTFNVVLPYAQSYDAITVAATPYHGSASIKAGASLTVSSLPGSATFTIVAQSGAEEDYTVNFSMGPKDGVCLIKGNVGNDSFVIDEEASLLSGTTYKNAVKSASTKYPDDETGLVGWKFNSKGAYLGFTLDGTEIFQENDVVEAYITYIDGGDKLRVFTDHADAAMLKEGDDLVLGVNKLLLPATSTQTLYLYRSPDGGTYQNWNPRVAYFAVYRPMMPTLTAITIDGRDGEIDALDDKHFSVTIPYESDLAALTVVPTIIRNAAHATTPEAVVSNAGAWVLGPNTYRVMDKDGDYTDYTITLTRDVLKHTVSFNTHGGSAVASELVEDGKYLAAAPADPTKEDYIFQYWSEDEDGAEVDVTTVQINADKEFHAVWASDGAIKLLDGSTVNHTNFITGVTADETVEFQGNTVNYAKFSGTVSGVNGVKDLTRVIAYNATTNKTKIRISAHNNSTSARNILVKGLVEGASEAVDLATIALGNKEDKVSDWIEFDNAANRTIYIMVSSSAGDVYFTQVKVIESGETPMKQAGEAGYALNLNKGRFFGLASTDLAFEGLNARLSGDYTALNSGYAKLTETSMSFTVASAMTLSVTTNNNKTYYVTKGAAGTDNETAKTGVSEFDLTAGTWYITAGAAEVQITNIAFAAPKCAEPVIDNDPESNTNFGQGNLTATVVAHATDGATLAYQWYDADDNEVAGATEATLTTTTEGTYYVIITASKAGYENRSVQSANATLGYRDNTIATLSALTYGTPAMAIVLEADKYNYRVTLDEGTTDVPALAATATQAAYGATAVPTDATAFTDYKAVSTVLVTAEDGTTTQTYTVTFVVQHIYAVMEDVTESTTWNWTGVETDDVNIDDVDNRGVILGNYISGDNFEMMEGKAGEKAFRNQNGGVYQGTYLHFNTTVPGRVKFYFRAPSSGETCTITVKNGGRTTIAGARGNSLGWSSEVFVNGDVVIEMENDKEGGGTTRVQQVVFTAAEADYTRDVTEGRYGTICLPNGGVMVGCALYEVAYFDASAKKIFFDEVLNGAMVAGTPYIFLPEENVTQLKVYYTDAANAPAGDANGLFGSYDKTELDQNAGNYILYNNQYLLVNSANVYVGENRAYIKIGVEGGVPTNAVAPAPGRRRVAMGVLNEQVITGVEDLNVGDQPIKVMIDGQLFILRGEKMYDAQGRLVK